MTSLPFDDLWCIVDSRTGDRMSVAAFLSEERARAQIESWVERDKLGIRSDCRPYLPYLVPKQFTMNLSAPPAPGNYYIDTCDGRVYHATVVLNDAENPETPPKIVSVPVLLMEDRFLIVRVVETDNIPNGNSWNK